MFTDRKDAGEKLAQALKKYKETPEAIVLGLPRGGVVTAYEVASELHLPLDVICPRKIGAPHNPELAIGAVCQTGEGFYNQDVIAHLGVDDDYIQKATDTERAVSQMRTSLYRKGIPPLHLENKTVIIVDDGIATGATMKAAIISLQGQKTKKIVVAVPVSPIDTAQELQEMADEVVVLATPPLFQAVGQFYDSFIQTEDDEVIEMLQSMYRNG